MKLLLSESAAELLGLLLSAVAAGVLTVVGALTEHAGVTTLQTGQSVLGLWEVGMGAIALYAGLYLLGYRRVLLPIARTVGN